jgi:hypothetical protein
MRNEIQDLFKRLDMNTSLTELEQLSVRDTPSYTPWSMDWEFSTAFNISTFSPQWSVKIDVLRACLRGMYEHCDRLVPELEKVDGIFSDYVNDLYRTINKLLQLLTRKIVELEAAEDTAQGAIQGLLLFHRIEGTQLIERTTDFNYMPPDTYPEEMEDRWPPSYSQSKVDLDRLESQSTESQKPFLRKCTQFGLGYNPRRGQPWKRIMSYFGRQKIVYFIVVFFCLIGAIFLGIAVWKTGPTTSIPVIDNNFFSTLAQTNLSIAAIYCIIIPLLRGDQNPVGKPCIFYCWVALSVLAALLSAVVYPFNGSTSVSCAFFSAFAQLAATLQWIQGSIKKIRHLEVEVATAREERRERRLRFRPRRNQP